MNTFPASTTPRFAAVALSAALAAASCALLSGCQQDKAADPRAQAAGAAPAGAPTASEKEKKIQDLDKAIARINANTALSAEDKQTAIAAMERGKASLRAN